MIVPTRTAYRTEQLSRFSCYLTDEEVYPGLALDLRDGHGPRTVTLVEAGWVWLDGSKQMMVCDVVRCVRRDRIGAARRVWAVGDAFTLRGREVWVVVGSDRAAGTLAFARERRSNAATPVVHTRAQVDALLKAGLLLPGVQLRPGPEVGDAGWRALPRRQPLAGAERRLRA